MGGYWDQFKLGADAGTNPEQILGGAQGGWVLAPVQRGYWDQLRLGAGTSPWGEGVLGPVRGGYWAQWVLVPACRDPLELGDWDGNMGGLGGTVGDGEAMGWGYGGTGTNWEELGWRYGGTGGD